MVGSVELAQGVHAANTEHVPSSKGRVRLRLARDTEANFQKGLALARNLHAQTLFRDLAFSEAKARALFQRVFARPDKAGLIYAEPPPEGAPPIVRRYCSSRFRLRTSWRVFS